MLGPIWEAGQKTPQIVPLEHLPTTPPCYCWRGTVAGGEGGQVLGVGSPGHEQEPPPAAAGGFRCAKGAWVKEPQGLTHSMGEPQERPRDITNCRNMRPPNWFLFWGRTWTPRSAHTLTWRNVQDTGRFSSWARFPFSSGPGNPTGKTVLALSPGLPSTRGMSRPLWFPGLA